MNPIQEFLVKAQVNGAQSELKTLKTLIREVKADKLKLENENAELRVALAEMQQLKERYQLVVIDLMAVLERHGLVS